MNEFQVKEVFVVVDSRGRIHICNRPARISLSELSEARPNMDLAVDLPWGVNDIQPIEVSKNTGCALDALYEAAINL